MGCASYMGSDQQASLDSMTSGDERSRGLYEQISHIEPGAAPAVPGFFLVQSSW